MGISLGLQHWKGLQVPRQTTYISYHSKPKPKISYRVVGFFFPPLYLLLHQSKSNLLVLLARAISVYSCSANRGRPAIKSKPGTGALF